MAYATRWAEPGSVLLGGLVMGANFWLLRIITNVLHPGELDPSKRGRVTLAIAAMTLKFGLFIGLLAALFWRVPIEGMSFPLGVTLLLVACLLGGDARGAVPERSQLKWNTRLPGSRSSPGSTFCRRTPHRDPGDGGLAGLGAWSALRQIQAATDAVIPDATLTARNALESSSNGSSASSKACSVTKGRTFVHVYGTFFPLHPGGEPHRPLAGLRAADQRLQRHLRARCDVVPRLQLLRLPRQGCRLPQALPRPDLVAGLFMLPLELIDNLVRPVSLALASLRQHDRRPSGSRNLHRADKDRGPVLVFYALGAFVSLIQAFVFTILSIIYLSLALAEHEDHEEAHAEHH